MSRPVSSLSMRLTETKCQGGRLTARLCGGLRRGSLARLGQASRTAAGEPQHVRIDAKLPPFSQPLDLRLDNASVDRDDRLTRAAPQGHVVTLVATRKRMDGTQMA